LLSPISSIANITLNTIIKPAFNATFATARALVNTGSDLIGTLVDGSVLGSTTVNIPTIITDPSYQDLASQVQNNSNPYEARFLATIVKSNVLSVNIASTNDGYTPVFYAAPTVNAPYNVSITGDSSIGYEVTGYADPNTTVRIYNDGVQIGEGLTDENGKFVKKPQYNQFC